MKMTRAMQATWDAYQQARALREAANRSASPNAGTDVTAALGSFTAALDSVTGDPKGRRGFRPRGRGTVAPTFVSVNGALVGQVQAQDNGDLAPTTAILAGWTKTCGDLRTVETSWQRVSTRDLAALNAVLARSHATPVASPSKTIALPEC